MRAGKLQTAYVLLSGGQDSLVGLLWAREQFEKTVAISVDYGQRHLAELERAKAIAKRYGAEHCLHSARDFWASFGPNASALLARSSSVRGSHKTSPNLPASFVPGRNGLLLNLAALAAYYQGERVIHLVVGVSEADYSGYPDCRYPYIKSKELELTHGLEREVVIHAPLMWKDKTDVLLMAEAYGELEACLFETLSCYEGNDSQKNEWGYGCSKCPACELRVKGYEAYMKGRPDGQG